MPALLLLFLGRPVRTRSGAAPDLVPVQHQRGPQRPRVARPATRQEGDRLPAPGQLLYLGGGLRTRPKTRRPSAQDPLGSRTRSPPPTRPPSPPTLAPR